MKTSKIILIVIGIFVGIAAISYAAGWYKVFYTKTVEKHQRDADREVYENTVSYVQGMRQQATKLYSQWLQADESEQAKIESIVAIEFADFDVRKLENPKLERFIEQCTYK